MQISSTFVKTSLFEGFASAMMSLYGTEVDFLTCVYCYGPPRVVFIVFLVWSGLAKLHRSVRPGLSNCVTLMAMTRKTITFLPPPRKNWRYECILLAKWLFLCLILLLIQWWREKMPRPLTGMRQRCYVFVQRVVRFRHCAIVCCGLQVWMSCIRDQLHWVKCRMTGAGGCVSLSKDSDSVNVLVLLTEASGLWKKTYGITTLRFAENMMMFKFKTPVTPYHSALSPR